MIDLQKLVGKTIVKIDTKNSKEFRGQKENLQEIVLWLNTGEWFTISTEITFHGNDEFPAEAKLDIY